MIRASTLLPVFALALGLASASLAMASDSGSSNATQDHAKAKAAQDGGCGHAPRYLEPGYCQN
jgi:hypothetical protein